jgi:hypothetical protein
MTRRPFDPRELDGSPDELGQVAEELERYTSLTAAETPHALEEGVMTAIAAEPAPRRGLLASLLAVLRGGGRANGPVRAVLVAATMVLAVVAVVAAGELASLFRNDQVGPSPVPTTIESPSVTPQPTPSTEPTPSLTPLPTPAVTEQPTPDESQGATTEPTETERPATPRPSGTPEEDHTETPHPSSSDG